MTSQPTPRQELVLRYVSEHPGATSKEVARGCGLKASAAIWSLEALHTKRLLGRQHSLRDLLPPRWFPEGEVQL